MSITLGEKLRVGLYGKYYLVKIEHVLQSTANVTPKKRLISNWVKIEGEPKIERKKKK